jgi:hypothetical protein
LILLRWTFSDPALPPGMTAEKVHAGVKVALSDFAGRGWQGEVCFINPDETAVPMVERCLAGDVYDCVVIGGGVRLPPNRLVLFEAVGQVYGLCEPECKSPYLESANSRESGRRRR